MNPTDSTTAPSKPLTMHPGAAPKGLALRALPAALLAGLLAWAAGESRLLWVQPVKVGQSIMGKAFEAPTAQTEQAAATATAALHYGAFGALLGLALGAAGGRSRYVLFGAALGLLLGAVAGTIVPLATVPAYHRLRYSFVDELVPSFLLHGAIWSVVGGAAGLGLGVGSGAGGRRIALAVAGGVLGGLVGTAVYELTSSVVFASSDGGEPIPGTASTRLLAKLLVATTAAGGALATLSLRRRTGP